MKPGTKWLVFSVGSAIFAAAVVGIFPVAHSGQVPPFLDFVMRIVFWPVILCVHLSGPGPRTGPPEKHFHEGTPVQLIAAAMGLFLTVIFWSGLAFVAVRAWRQSRRTRATEASSTQLGSG